MKNITQYVNEALKISDLVKEYTDWMTEDGLKPRDKFYGMKENVKEFLENYHEDNMDLLEELFKAINSNVDESEELVAMSKGHKFKDYGSMAGNVYARQNCSPSDPKYAYYILNYVSKDSERTEELFKALYSRVIEQFVKSTPGLVELAKHNNWILDFNTMQKLYLEGEAMSQINID